MKRSIGVRLEQYTLKRPQEVLIVSARVGGEEDCITIFKGFSSSLMRPTAFDPDVPVLPEEAEILSVDRLQGPYNPSNPQMIQAGLTLEDLERLLSEVGV